MARRGVVNGAGPTPPVVPKKVDLTKVEREVAAEVADMSEPRLVKRAEDEGIDSSSIAAAQGQQDPREALMLLIVDHAMTVAAAGGRTRQTTAPVNTSQLGVAAPPKPSPLQISESRPLQEPSKPTQGHMDRGATSAIRDTERKYVPASQSEAMSISPAEARRRGLSVANAVEAVEQQPAEFQGHQEQPTGGALARSRAVRAELDGLSLAELRERVTASDLPPEKISSAEDAPNVQAAFTELLIQVELNKVGSDGFKAKTAVKNVAQRLRIAKALGAGASERATMTQSQTMKAMMSSLAEQDLDQLVGGQLGDSASSKNNGRRPGVQMKGKALTPAEKRKADEEAAKGAHMLGVKQIAAVTKMSTRLVARRRALSQVEKQTNWIAKAVFSAATRKGPLTLNLLGCNVNDSAAIRLATTLATSDIKTLNLTFNQIGDVGANAIARALKATPALTELGLGSNLITDHGAVNLATALKDERSCLTFLNLSGNMIGDRGAAALGEMLEVNPSLVEVCLDSNFIASQGKDALMSGMYKNASNALEFVSLAGNVRSGLLYKLRESLVTRIIWKP